ncbi:unnamed protein product [Rhizoctonia solani]|uniref:Uncharacterized protein n=1 Tax=Rhizoctonia solani TaxID=456999 RepID=A0A8H2XMQ9_9AGAM|nr:unnamed protein product [Rhizoctonia solani]
MTRSIQSRETSTLEIFNQAQGIQDAIMVTWVIMETMTRGPNPANTPGIGNGARSGQGVLGGRGGDGRCGGGDGGGGD